MKVDWYRYVFRDPAKNSNKYWMIYYPPGALWVLYRWGRQGSRGQFKLDKSYDALSSMWEKQREKQGKGYYLDSNGTRKCDPVKINLAVNSGDCWDLLTAIQTRWEVPALPVGQTYFFEELL
jgi:predicted DNA-binding WGR domain protein